MLCMHGWRIYFLYIEERDLLYRHVLAPRKAWDTGLLRCGSQARKQLQAAHEDDSSDLERSKLWESCKFEVGFWRFGEHDYISEYIHIWTACCLHPALRRSARCHCGSQECPATRRRNCTHWGLICLSTRTNKEGKARFNWHDDTNVTHLMIWSKTSTYILYIHIIYWITWYNISIPFGWPTDGRLRCRTNNTSNTSNILASMPQGTAAWCHV